MDPSSTSDTILANIEAIDKAVVTAAANFNICYQAPASCDPATVYAPKSPALARLSTFISDALTSGRYLSGDARGSYVVVESIQFISPTEASATVCNFDAGITLGPNGPDGKPTVIDDTISSLRSERKLKLVGSNWMVSGVTTLEHLGEGNKCAAER